MIRGIVIFILVVALGYGGWLVYKQVTAGASVGSGDVSVRDAPAEKDRSDVAYTDLDGNRNNPQPTTTYDRNAAPTDNPVAVANQQPSDRPAPVADSSTPLVSPTLAPIPDNQIQTAVPASGTNMLASASPAALPVSDTIAPNPPNGAVFTGSGKFQWYRQGNITWRVNSGNGAACVAFATMEEWQKQIVYTHGCGTA